MKSHIYGRNEFIIIMFIKINMIAFRIHGRIICKIYNSEALDILEACQKRNPYSYKSFLTVGEEYVTFNWNSETYDIPIEKFQTSLREIL